MPNQDQEIAESRERFEKWAKSTVGSDNWIDTTIAKRGVYYYSDTRHAWQIWQAAERDTRERDAQLVEDHWDEMDKVELAERIRGKGEA